MSVKSVFEKIDALISLAETKQGEATSKLFYQAKKLEEKVKVLKTEDIQTWVSEKSSTVFKSIRFANKKAEEVSSEYLELIKPTSFGSFLPVGVEEDI